MTTQNSCALAPVLSIVNNQVTALSTDVAQFFQKAHRQVIASIESLIEALPFDRVQNFVQTSVTRANPKNPQVQIQSKAYRMTRDGFTLLVMGWTGEKALQFKLAWLDAFNAMEEQLRKQKSFAEDNSLITPEQQYEISSHVMRKTHALFGQRNYSTVYRALKRRFRIPRYTCLLSRDYQTALDFIDSLTKEDFNLPDVEEEKTQPLPSKRIFEIQYTGFTICSGPTQTDDIPVIPASKTFTITEQELKAIKAFVYFFDELFKPLIQWAGHEAFKQKHPQASRFYDVWHEPLWFLGRMKEILKRNNA